MHLKAKIAQWLQSSGEILYTIALEIKYAQVSTNTFSAGS